MVLKEASFVVHLRLRRPAVSLAYPDEFPKKEAHTVLGFHRYSLTGGFLAIPRAGFEDVLSWAEAGRVNVAQDARTQDVPIPDSVAEELAGRNRNVMERPQRPAAPTVKPDLRHREKRTAGQHTVSEGRKRAALWTVAELGASVFGIKSVERHARQKVREAERT